MLVSTHVCSYGHTRVTCDCPSPSSLAKSVELPAGSLPRGLAMARLHHPPQLRVLSSQSHSLHVPSIDHRAYTQQVTNKWMNWCQENM